jgi:hypothetical protein
MYLPRYLDPNYLVIPTRAESGRRNLLISGAATQR